MKRLVAIDRDGTIIVGRPYLSDARAVELLPGAAAGIRRLRELGLAVAMVTNQSGIGRGYFSLETLQAIHGRLLELLRQSGATLDGIHFCPHHPDEGCACRKPGTGMLEAAAREHGASLADAFVLGDNACDIEAGRRVGATTVLVSTGYGQSTLRAQHVCPDHVVEDLAAGAGLIARLLGGTQAEWARGQLLGSARTMQAIAETCLDEILAAGDRIGRCLRAGGKVMFCGNGGSAADSAHLAAEFTNRLRPDFDRPPLAALALASDGCFLTAHANDYRFATVFARQIEALGRAGDVLVCLSTSGNSDNVLQAATAARGRGIGTVGLLGGSGGKLRQLVDLAIVVPEGSTQHVQEGHLAIGHLLVELAEELVFSGAR